MEFELVSADFYGELARSVAGEIGCDVLRNECERRYVRDGGRTVLACSARYDA